MANMVANSPAANGSTLWMGDIDEEMNESFIKTSFNLMNVNPVNVKLVRNRYTGGLLGYGFITFESEEVAEKVLREVNGQLIPNSVEGKRFRLNHTSTKEDEFSIYVGDLNVNVNDSLLFSYFMQRYPSVLSAKVMISDGQSRRFGFVRFGHEADYRRALADGQSNHLAISSQPITVRPAKPRRQRFNSYKSRTFVASETMIPGVPQVVAQQPEVQESVYGYENVSPYYGGVSVTGQPVLVYPMMPYGAFPVNCDNPYVYGQQPYGQQVYYQTCDNLYSLVPNAMYMDQLAQNQLLEAKQMDKLNDEMIARNQEFYSSIDNSRWSSQIEPEKEAKVQ